MGLFSNTDKSCLIKNFKIINSYFQVSGSDPVGSVASNGCGTFDTIYSDAIISTDSQNSGGLIGIANKGKQANAPGQTTKISNCWFDGEIRLTTKAGYLSGGIVGLINGGTCNVYHCLNSGDISSVADITAGVYVGGIAGRLLYENYSGTAYIKDSLNVGHIQTALQTGVGEIIGGIASKASISLSNTYMLMGNLEVCNKISGTFNGGAVAIDTEMISGPQWYSWTALDFSQYWAVTEDGTPVLKSFADKIPDVSGLAKMYSFDWFDENRSENYINTAEDLYGFALLSQENNFENCFISLGNDIVINEGNAADWAKKAPEKMWFPIAGGLTSGQMFKGVFDGQGYTISGLYLKTNIPGSGLFTGASNESAIQNFKLTNSYFEYDGEIGSNAVFGSVAGRANGTVSNIYSNAIVKSTG